MGYQKGKNMLQPVVSEAIHQTIVLDQKLFSIEQLSLARFLKKQAASFGVSIGQLVLPADNRRAWIINQLTSLYQKKGITPGVVEAYLLSYSLPIVTVALDDDRIVAACIAKVSTEQYGERKYIDILGIVCDAGYEYATLDKAVWAEMMQNIYREFFVS